MPGRSVTIATGPGHRAKVSSIKKLEVKVRKNTRILNSRDVKLVRTEIDTTPDTTAVIQNVSLVAQGVTASGRVGRKIHAQSMELKGIIASNATATFNSYRIILFRDNLGNTTAPTRGDLFESEDDFFNNKPRNNNVQNLKRFTFLMDRHIILNESFDADISARSFNFKKKLNFNILYTGAASTDEGKNSLWVISGSDEATNVPSVQIDGLFTYSDL